MARDYKAEYQRRRALSKARGYTSPRTERDSKSASRGRKRDYALERERANVRARGRGFLSVSDERAFKRSGNEDREAWQKARALKYFGISEYRFNKMRKENRHYFNEAGQLHYSTLNTYQIDVDSRVHDWSIERVGYIVYFNRAIVDPATNYASLTRGQNKRGYGIREIDPKTGKPKVNKEHFYYLVKYGGGMSVNEYESRYGIIYQSN